VFPSRAPRSPRTTGRQDVRSGLRSRTVRLAAACALAVPALLASTAGNAAAGQSRPVAHDHAMGSTIAAHEGSEAPSLAPSLMPSGPKGIDVSHWQGSINWNSVRAACIRFAYIKATEGTGYTDPRFDANYIHSYNQGVIRGAYHFARPDQSSGYTQANFFVNNGGGWSGDGKTMPPLLDIEYNPSGPTCYGKSDSGMVSWIRSFSNRVKTRTGRYPVIYTTNDWWRQCTGNSGAFAKTNALFIARYNSTVGQLPNFPTWTIWQYTSTGSVSGVSGNVDRDVFHGSLDRLKAFARCTEENPC
jgi:GH25 family lysozyme M1 (1,4-beta-N-acetylmuramidase)